MGRLEPECQGADGICAEARRHESEVQVMNENEAGAAPEAPVGGATAQAAATASPEPPRAKRNDGAKIVFAAVIALAAAGAVMLFLQYRQASPAAEPEPARSMRAPASPALQATPVPGTPEASAVAGVPAGAAPESRIEPPPQPPPTAQPGSETGVPPAASPRPAPTFEAKSIPPPASQAPASTPRPRPKPATPAAPPAGRGSAPPAAPAPRPEPPRAASAPAAAAIPVTREPLVFPREAAARGIESGSVRARLLIDAAGNVKEVRIQESRPARHFDREATRSLSRWQFNPGAEDRTYDVEISFSR